ALDTPTLGEVVFQQEPRVEDGAIAKGNAPRSPVGRALSRRRGCLVAVAGWRLGPISVHGIIHHDVGYLAASDDASSIPQAVGFGASTRRWRARTRTRSWKLLTRWSGRTFDRPSWRGRWRTPTSTIRRPARRAFAASSALASLK